MYEMRARYLSVRMGGVQAFTSMRKQSNILTSDVTAVHQDT